MKWLNGWKYGGYSGPVKLNFNNTFRNNIMLR